MQQEIKLLIVDDSSIIRQSIEKYLTAYNIKVVGTAADGKAAIEVFKLFKTGNQTRVLRASQRYPEKTGGAG